MLQHVTTFGYLIFPGGYDMIDMSRSRLRGDILEYDPETKKWTQIGTMREGRCVHAVSVVKYKDYADFCH